MKLLVLLASAAVAALMAGGTSVAAQETVAQGVDGMAVYQASCANCHQADGSGVQGIFPPLAGNPAAADASYVESVIRDGLSGTIVVLGETYNSTMTPVPLSDEEVDAVVAYVVSIAGDEPTEPAPPVVVGPAEADAVRGQALFEGASTFGSGAPACRSCHTAGEQTLLAGSTLGPDLTDAVDRFGGAAGLAGWMASPPSPTMQPIFSDQPLTEDEVADVVAYLDGLEGSADFGIDWLMIAGLIGFLALIGFMALFVQGPRQTYAQQLRSRS